MTEWLIRLKGHQVDLEEFSGHFTSDDLNVRKDEDDHYYLRSSRFDQMADPADVREQATDLIAHMSDNVKFCVGGDRRIVELDLVTQADQGGARHHIYITTAPIELRSRVSLAKVSTGDGDDAKDAPQPPSGVVVSLKLADRCPSYAVALHFYGQGDWINLYKAWEVVCDAIGNEHALIKQGWVTKKTKDRFAQTAQSRAVLGDEARHASGKYPAPKNPMTLDEATSFVHFVIGAWAKRLLADLNGTS